MSARRLVSFVAILFVCIGGCAPRTTGPRDGDGTCDPDAPECGDGLVCAAVVGADARCLAPVIIRGHVLALVDDGPIAGALVQAVDVNGAAVGTTAATDADGAYELTVPAVRGDEGEPLEGVYTLRVQAAGFQEFPTAIRPALPLDATTAVISEDEDPWVIENALTTVKLIALPGDTSTLGSISGSIEAEKNAGILVVAETTDGALTGFSDGEGGYTIFNVAAGSYTVRGFAAGVQISATNVSLEAGEESTGIDLSESDNPLNTVSGSVQIVNAPGGSLTSVVLAVESTFVAASARGAVPPGLRVGDIAGAFTLEEVPDGRYVVLAAFENDGLVRDPDQTIGGTAIVRIELPDPDAGNVLAISEGFKVTGALATVFPGSDGPEEISTATPLFEWEDDSSEDGYDIRVLDAFGNEVWAERIASVSGSETVTLLYAGPPLEPGIFYQFRVTSFRDKNDVETAISITEDLKGVFFLASGSSVE